MRAIVVCVLWAIGACLNPLPEEFPSNDDSPAPPRTEQENPASGMPSLEGDNGSTPQNPSAGGGSVNEPPAGSDGNEEGSGVLPAPDAGADAGPSAAESDATAASDAAADAGLAPPPGLE